MRRILVTLLVVLAAGGAANAADDRLTQQRTAFREAYTAAELGDWAPAAAHAALLKDYVLWPDLRAAWLKTQLAGTPRADIDAFLDRYGTLKAARELRYRLALHLASTGRLPEYLAVYQTWYQGLQIPRLDCLAGQAEILAGHGPAIANRAIALWLVGHSQVDECDPVFDYLRGAGVLDGDRYRQRYDLAMAAGQYSLARYLARSVDDAALAEAGRWLDAERDPEGFLAREAGYADSEPHRERVVAALERVARSDARLASRRWREIRERRDFDAGRAAAVSRHIALWLARRHDPEALERLGELPAAVVDPEVRRWRARAALAKEAWPDVIAAIDAMPEALRGDEEWRYWLATATRQTGDDDTARQIWTELATQRSYYGFLAADELDRDYAWGNAAIVPDRETLRRLGRIPALVRARELFYVGLESRGRSEWDDAVALLSADDKVQAAMLAHRWGWHSRAIATVADVGSFDDLEIRYPLAYPDTFASAAAAARIPDSWAYGVARSESLFIPDIRSHAGAIGIMQLLPATGRSTAGELKLPFDGLPTLTDPVSNIRLGTSYLGKMLQRFGNNRVVATAAYNAGPSRVEEWLPDSERVDARIWIENIPFNETREYVRRVMVSDAIFNWRLTGGTERLADGLRPVAPATQQLAGGTGR